MAIKAGELITVGGLTLLDRLQTGGPGNVNIPTEKIYELGNYNSVATIRDIADLTFTMESLDVAAEAEALLVNGDFAGDPAGTEYKLDTAVPLDVVSQFKRGRNAGATEKFEVAASVALPYLALESASYRFGLRDNAQQTFTLRGDSIFFAEASAYVQEVAGSGAADQTIQLTNDPIPYTGDAVGGTRYALGVMIVETGRRLSFETDWTEAVDTPLAGNVTLTILEAVPVDQTIRIVYQSATVASYPQASHAAASATRPAAIKGRDIEVRVGGNAVGDRWSSIQSAQVDYRVNLERDEELGNAQIVGQDYDVPDVNGSIELKPFDAAELITRLRQIANVAADEAIGPYTSQPLSLDIILHSPDDGSVIKTLYVPDARFVVPGFSGRVQQKMNVTLNFESDTGQLSVFKGARA